jgi:hypothetical protein
LRRLAELLDRGKMHGIKRADGFYRKRPANAGENSRCDRDNIAMAFEDMERLYCSALLVGIQAPVSARADKGARGLGECKSGSYLASLDTQRVKRRDILFQQRGEQSARLDVPDAESRA